MQKLLGVIVVSVKIHWCFKTSLALVLLARKTFQERMSITKDKRDKKNEKDRCDGTIHVNPNFCHGNPFQYLCVEVIDKIFCRD